MPIQLIVTLLLIKLIIIQIIGFVIITITLLQSTSPACTVLLSIADYKANSSASSKRKLKWSVQGGW